jgi:MFS superfamily sulfate permease-like transporter
MSDSKTQAPAVPLTGIASLRADILSGLLVFLIAMPLCLAIANASGFKPICGIWTAVVGGLITTWISNSQLTIKGPAAGMIAIVAGCVAGMRDEFCTPALFPGASEAELAVMAFQMAAGVAVVAGAIQFLFGVFRIGKLGDFFPLAAVHGLLASIGIIIISKSIPILLGVDARTVVGSTTIGKMTPIPLLGQIPAMATQYLTRDVAIIGLISLVILFTVPLIKSKWVRLIPTPMLVLLMAVPLGFYLELPKAFNVDMPDVLTNPKEAFFFPDFSKVATGIGIKSIILFAVIGSLESLLSAKAIDLLDPQKRKTNLDRDMMGIGFGNCAVAFISGLPMISEIVRSSANINNGAQTRRANFFHGVFLLLAALFLSSIIAKIPLSALAAMLIFTGFRLAHPREFIKTYKVGKEQLIIFVTTIIVTLTTDMLIGVLSGVVVKFLLHLLHGMPFKAAWKPTIEVEETDPNTARIVVHDAAVFTNWLVVKGRIARFAPSGNVTLDLSDVHLVDHSVMEKLHELEQEFGRSGGQFHVTGLESHRKLSDHPQAARKKVATSTRADKEVASVP